MSCICIFSALYLPNMGGVERFTDSLAAELVAEGHSVIVVTNNIHGLSNREVLDNGVEVIRFPCKNFIDGRYPVPIKNGRHRELIADLGSRQVDGVLVNTRFYLHSLIGVRFAESKGLRAVVLDHGSAYLTLGSRLLDWAIERYEDGITAWLKRHDVDFYGISKKSVEWLGHFGIEAKGVSAMQSMPRRIGRKLLEDSFVRSWVLKTVCWCHLLEGPSRRRGLIPCWKL